MFEEFIMEEVPNFQLLCSQNSDLDDERLDEIEQKAQAKNTNSRNDASKEKLQWI